MSDRVEIPPRGVRHRLRCFVALKAADRRLFATAS
jgi:hypothetical protein